MVISNYFLLTLIQSQQRGRRDLSLTTLLLELCLKTGSIIFLIYIWLVQTIWRSGVQASPCLSSPHICLLWCSRSVALKVIHLWIWETLPDRGCHPEVAPLPYLVQTIWSLLDETNGYCDKAALQNGQRIKVFTIYVFQLDEDGNFQTTIVAIDATQFKTKPRGVQYEESALVRELNKALVGFYNPEVGSEIIRSTSGVYYFIKLQGDLLLDKKMSDLPRGTNFCRF